MSSFIPDRRPELDVGDRAVAVQHLGGFIRPKVRRGTAGTVVERSPEGTLRVTFASRPTLAVHPYDLSLPDPRDAPTS